MDTQSASCTSAWILSATRERTKPTGTAIPDAESPALMETDDWTNMESLSREKNVADSFVGLCAGLSRTNSRCPANSNGSNDSLVPVCPLAGLTERCIAHESGAIFRFVLAERLARLGRTIVTTGTAPGRQASDVTEHRPV